MFRSIPCASSGIRPSSSARFRRRFTMNGTWRIDTGHSCMHAMHVVQAHSSSTPTYSGSGSPSETPFASFTIASRRSRITRIGSNVFPVLHAGHTDVHRPQIVHASSWRRSNHGRAFVVAVPSAGCGASGFIRSSASNGLSSRPYGTARSKYVFAGLNRKWLAFVHGGGAGEENGVAAWDHHRVGG